MAVQTDYLSKEQISFLLDDMNTGHDMASPISEIDPDNSYGISEEQWVQFKMEMELDQRCWECGFLLSECECE